MAIVGSPQTGLLNRLNASRRNCSDFVPPKKKFRISDASVVKMPGPITMLRPAFP
jgi:hypothetical protein